MKIYRVKFYETDCEGRIPCGAKPEEKFFLNKATAEIYTEPKRKSNWVAGVKVEEIEAEEE